MVNPPDHASYAYVFANSGRRWLPIRCSQKCLEHPNRLSGLQVRPPALFREAHFWTTKNMICSVLPHVGRRQLPLTMQPFELFRNAVQGSQHEANRGTTAFPCSMSVSIDL